MILTSPAFSEGGRLPARYATPSVPGGENASIPYQWTGVPPEAQSLALALVDEAPVAHRWVHWLLVDLPPDAAGLPEKATGSSDIPSGARELANTRGAHGYSGPQPPPGSGEHPYVATLYALDVATLETSQNPSADEFEGVVAGHVIGTASLTGYFGR